MQYHQYTYQILGIKRYRQYRTSKYQFLSSTDTRKYRIGQYKQYQEGRKTQYLKVSTVCQPPKCYVLQNIKSTNSMLTIEIQNKKIYHQHTNNQTTKYRVVYLVCNAGKAILVLTELALIRTLLAVFLWQFSTYLFAVTDIGWLWVKASIALWVDAHGRNKVLPSTWGPRTSSYLLDVSEKTSERTRE